MVNNVNKVNNVNYSFDVVSTGCPCAETPRKSTENTINLKYLFLKCD